MMRSVKLGSLACLLSMAALVGCGDDDGAAAVGGGAATGGVGGGGGTGGSGDADAGDTDAGGSGGTGGTGGSGGTGGTGGSGGSGGTGGTGGGSACATDCDDNIDCTSDSCVGTVCVHVIDPSVCADGESCHPQRGCELGGACSVMAPCVNDGCMVNLTCDASAARCEWEPLDGDGDGQSPVSCGGEDCDDAAQAKHPGAQDVCNGSDDDCDSVIDEGATCENGQSCIAGACVCPEGKRTCGGQCINPAVSSDHCGRCNNDCGEAGFCMNGGCMCSAPGAICDGECVNTMRSHDNCGSCGAACANNQICDNGQCIGCGAEDQPCCGDTVASQDGCPGSDLLCVGSRGQPLSVCTCPNDHLLCNGGGLAGDECIDPQTDNDNCGGCGQACSIGVGGLASETCINGACEPCGQEVGQVCCTVGSLIGGPMLACNNALNPLLRCNRDTGLCRLGLFP